MNFYNIALWVNNNSFLSAVASKDSLIITVIIAILVYNYTHQRWLNDVYAKREGEYWLDYRENFYNSMQDFLNFIGYISSPNTGFAFTQLPKENFEKNRQAFYKLTKLHKFMKPYINLSKNFDYNEIYNILVNISLFFENLIESTTEKDYDYEEYGTPSKNYYYFWKNKDKLIIELNQLAFRVFNYKTNDLTDEDYKLIYELFENKTSQINEILENKIILQYKK